MEQTPNNAHAATGKNVSYQFLVEQSHSIQRLHEALHSNILAYGLNTLLSVIFQMVCYALFVLAIILAIVLPSDLSIIELSVMDFNITSISFDGIKIALTIASVPIFICAYLLGRNRRRAARMRRAFEELETLKRSHSYMMSSMK